jgi:hypothetical protein
MRRPLNGNILLLGGLGVLLLLVGSELGRRFLIAPPARPQPVPVSAAAPSGRFNPAFKVGELAPDFTLPDASGTKRRLSELVHRDTLLCFACGCAQCLDIQTYLGILKQRLGPKGPDVISVTTMPVEREQTWVRDTSLKQTFLYETKNGPIMALYKGHPCPRLYRLKADRTVSWIGSSPLDEPELERLGHEMAANLGFPPEGGGIVSPPPRVP